MEFTVNLDDALAQELIRRGLSIDLTPALQDAAFYQQRALQSRIYKEITASGAPFAPLRPATLARKKSKSILRETGVLVNAFLTLLIGKDRAVIRNPTFYAPFLHFGTSRMAARPFMEFSADDQKAIELIVDDFIRRRVFP